MVACSYFLPLLFDYTGDNDNFVKEDGTTRMPGWTYYDTQNGYDVWENQYYIPMGFSYDYYYTEEQYNQLYEDNRNLLLLKAIVLDEEQATKYQDILEPAVGNTSFLLHRRSLLQGLSQSANQWLAQILLMIVTGLPHTIPPIRNVWFSLAFHTKAAGLPP